MARKKMERWGPHSHCIVCGAAIPEGEKFCSSTCKAKYEEEEARYKRSQRNLLVMMLLMLAFIATVVFLPYLTRSP